MRSTASASVLIAAIVLSLSPAGGHSQQGSAPPVPTQQFLAPPSEGCPIRYSAVRYGLSATVRETGGGPVRQYPQRLRVVFDADAVRRIVRIAGLVHGQQGDLEVMPAQAGVRPRTARASDKTEPFEFRASGGRLDGVQFLYTNTIPLITRIEITEIEFKDGTVWARSPAESCSVAPSPFVLVNAGVQ